MRVDVYWNLTRRVWSVKQKGKVVGHYPAVTLRAVSWVVQAAGREYCRRKGMRWVHAVARGELISTTACVLNGSDGERVTYNPFVDDTFVVERDRVKLPVTSSTGAVFSSYHGADGRDHGVAVGGGGVRWVWR